MAEALPPLPPHTVPAFDPKTGRWTLAWYEYQVKLRAFLAARLP